jgi:hypothetical protein
MKTKMVVMSKTAKNPKEVVIIVDEENQTAFNETTGKTIKLDSIRKNYNVISEEPIKTEETNEETIEETSPETNTDDTNEVKNDDEVKHVENEKSNADETNNEEQNEAEAEMEPFPFENIEIEKDIHKKHGEILIITVKYNDFTTNFHIFDDNKEKCFKPIKRGCKVHAKDVEKMVVNTTSVKKALEAMKIDNVAHAKQTLLSIKNGGLK